MISLGMKFPAFTKKAVVSLEAGKEFKTISLNDYTAEKKWLIMFWYPKDFTFVCPTEIVEFSKMADEFYKKNTALVAASTDSEYVHLAWRKADSELSKITIPMLADTSKTLADELGILTDDEKVAYRVTFIVNPEGIIQWICANNLDVGRNVDEVVRVLDALQVGGLMPCNWKPGMKTL